jgi:predicted RNA-binding protein YlqC (UPF0109 family)
VQVSISGEPGACEDALTKVWEIVQGVEADEARASPYIALTADGKALARQSFHLLVSASHAGSLIGEGGSEIQAIRDQCGGHVSVQSSDEFKSRADFQRGVLAAGERIVLFSGQSSEIHAARRLVLERLFSMPTARTSRGVYSTGLLRGTVLRLSATTELTERNGVIRSKPGEELVSEMLTVPPEAAGQIVGVGGSTIRQLREALGCSLTLTNDPYSLDAEPEQVLTIVGTPSAIADAKELIARVVAGESLPRSGGSRGGGTRVSGFVSAGVVQKGSLE